ncbi:MAG: response regulator [Candidatus Pacebacteria bacterium]|nr:response regulator [Candidatus Paceibacterota bacterium]
MESENKSKIFFVEDEPGIADLYAMSFSSNGFEIESFVNGKDALKRLTDYKSGKASKPDVIILDILLPDISGIEILKEIRKNKEFDSVPVIMLTNYGTDEIREEIKKIPKTSHVLKIDTSPQLFVRYVREVLKGKGDANIKNIAETIEITPMPRETESKTISDKYKH